ncbi:hypothetical protein KIPE111705_23310 [Kibdelosporangium persicum]|uniref:Uncharacterized protein n=1 Tax=Kibdelosporangium persicum TaxID=2698649 RepID=A0ABX2F425_9PSEU|nr:hypothetical protein [Kibdelosporangium persicum]NRN65750.1 hypothetical protein [Kibdelosporangium persicum]
MTHARKTALINIRGWLEGSQDGLELAQRFIQDDAANNWYNFGWTFPHQQVTGHWYAFFGLHVDDGNVDWFLNQLRHLATLAASGAKPLIRGLFVISNEEKTMSQVHVRDGHVHITPGDPKLAYLDA